MEVRLDVMFMVPVRSPHMPCGTVGELKANSGKAVAKAGHGQGGWPQRSQVGLSHSRQRRSMVSPMCERKWVVSSQRSRASCWRGALRTEPISHDARTQVDRLEAAMLWTGCLSLEHAGRKFVYRSLDHHATPAGVQCCIKVNLSHWTKIGIQQRLFVVS